MMVKYFWNFLKSLKKWKRIESSSFWGCSIFLYVSFSVCFGVLFPESESTSQTVIDKNTPWVLDMNTVPESSSQIVMNKNIPSVLYINSDGGGSKQKSNSFVLRTGSGKRKKFNLVFHRRVEKYFTDWEERIDYQKKQEKFYKLAMKRRNDSGN